MKAIVCVDKNWGIGKNNNLLFNLPEDMKRFREETKNKVVIMGLNTFKSLPNGPLKNRINIILDSANQPIAGAIVVPSLYELSLKTSQYNPEDLFLIGGASLYQQLVPFCTEVLVTKVDADGEADRFFPNLDESSQWKVVYKGEELISQSGLKYCFYTYKFEESVND